MTLLSFATTIYPAGRITLKSNTADSYIMVARLFTEFAKSQGRKQLRLKELTPELAVAWLRHLLATGHAATTANSYRASLVTLWRAAARKKLAPPVPDTEDLPKCKIPTECPVSWMPSELERLLAQCELLKGNLQRWRTIRRRDFWVSLILFLYETGARIGAALDVRPGDVDLNRNLVRLRSGAAKTLLGQAIRISDQCSAAIRAIHDPARQTVWPCGKHRHELYNRLTKLLEQAELPSDRLSKFHRIRRTTATQTALHGGLEMAQRQLGHTSIKMTLKYIDPTVVRPVQAVDVIPSLKTSG